MECYIVTILILSLIVISYLSSTYKCNFLGADNKQ